MLVATEENLYKGHLSCYAHSLNSACENLEQMNSLQPKARFCEPISTSKWRPKKHNFSFSISHCISPFSVPHSASFPFSAVPRLNFLPKHQSAGLFLNFKAINMFLFLFFFISHYLHNLQNPLKKSAQNLGHSVVIQCKEIISN